MTTKVAGVDGLSETKKYSLKPFRKCVFVNLCAISVVFRIAWKRAVFGWNYTGAVYGQSYNGPYRIRIVSSTKAFQKAPIPSFVIEQRMLGVLPFEEDPDLSEKTARSYNFCHPESTAQQKFSWTSVHWAYFSRSSSPLSSTEGVCLDIQPNNRILLPLVFHWAGPVQSLCWGSRVESRMKTGQLILICYSSPSLNENRKRTNRPPSAKVNAAERSKAAKMSPPVLILLLLLLSQTHGRGRWFL